MFDTNFPFRYYRATYTIGAPEYPNLPSYGYVVPPVMVIPARPVSTLEPIHPTRVSTNSQTLVTSQRRYGRRWHFLFGSESNESSVPETGIMSNFVWIWIESRQAKHIKNCKVIQRHKKSIHLFMTIISPELFYIFVYTLWSWRNKL